MATNSTWTVVFEDRKILKKTGSDQGAYVINDDSFWSNNSFSNIWAIQYGTSNPSDEVEYRDETPHSTFADANIGDIKQFSDKWDAAHLAKIQSDWDDDNVEGETAEEKITRLGARPTSYSS
jgi:hypothetical protein